MIHTPIQQLPSPSVSRRNPSPSHELRRLVAVFSGGVAGTAGRVLLIDVVPESTGVMQWPIFLANILGAFRLGWFVTRGAASPWRSDLIVPFFAIGLLGSLTTFSALMVDVVESVRDGLAVGGIGYGLASVFAGLAAAALGMSLAWAKR